MTRKHLCLFGVLMLLSGVVIGFVLRDGLSIRKVELSTTDNGPSLAKPKSKTTEKWKSTGESSDRQEAQTREAGEWRVAGAARLTAI